KTLVSEQLSGQSGPCVECGKSVTIPDPPAARRTDILPAEQRDAPVISTRPRAIPNWMIRTALFSTIALPLIVFTIWVVSPTVVKLKAQRDITICKQNLTRIAKAINAYAAEYGSYPPAVTYDANGTAMHSWRVLILPYLGEKKLYESYSMSVPWDAPENAHVQAEIPEVYLSPANAVNALGESSYMLVTGKGTLFPPGKPGNASTIPDGARNTILVVETNQRSRAWTEPIDLNFATLPAQIGALGGIGGSHQGGATAVLADGTPIWLPSDTTKSVIDSLISPGGRETVEGNWYK
ncbi:MAG: DUF1559 domain-containing protein, partial [Pirellulaceae bacterium]|nr:DUF1559 domain-containing protein [Pirellulaceae bacterium]